MHYYPILGSYCGHAAKKHENAKQWVPHTLSRLLSLHAWTPSTMWATNLHPLIQGRGPHPVEAGALILFLVVSILQQTPPKKSDLSMLPMRSLNVTWGFCFCWHAKRSHQVQSSTDRNRLDVNWRSSHQDPSVNIWYKDAAGCFKKCARFLLWCADPDPESDYCSWHPIFPDFALSHLSGTSFIQFSAICHLVQWM